jgi:beta-fructofuranosidase
VNFEQEGEEGKGFIEGIDGYGFARPQDNVYKVDIYTDNSVLVLYINDNVAYTQHIYGIQKNCWSINNYGGSVNVSDLKVSQY